MTKPRFTGVFTALVTPFHDDGTVDLTAYRALIEDQLAMGLSGLVPCGTTGEASTLTTDEHAQVVKTCVDTVNKRVPVIAGSGANDTKKAIETHKRIAELGVDGSLQVTPWYNKPTQEGLYRHFRAVAESNPLPIVLYNVPGRTGVDMLPETIVRLAKDCPSIVAVKEATGSIQRAQDNVLAGTWTGLLYLNRTFAFSKDLDNKISALTAADLLTAIKKHLDPAKITMVKAGDFAKVAKVSVTK